MIDTNAIRKRILDLAIQGKLTIHDDNELSIDDIHNIKIEKEQLVTNKIIKKPKYLKPVSEEEKTFEIPGNWSWIRLDELCKIITDGTHKTPNYKKDGIPFLSVKNISSGKFDLSDIKYISIEEHQELKKRCNPEKDDILICRIGTLGKAITISIDLEFSIFVSLGLLKPVCNSISEYIARVINSGYGMEWIQANKAGGAMHTYKINLDSLRMLPVPFPPISEQYKIVARVDEIFKQLDFIDEMQQKYALDIEILKSKLIETGIQGKLTEQLSEDGTAEELYAGIQEKKAKIIESGILKGRKNKKVNNVVDADGLFAIPNNWKWIRLGDVCEIFGRIGFRGYTKADIVEANEGAITISPSNIDGNGNMHFEECTYLSWFKYEESPEIQIENEDIIIVKTGSSYGKAGIVKNLPEKATINPQLAVLKYVYCNKDYLNYVLNCSSSRKQYEQFVIGAAIPTFSQEKLANLLIPLPPLAEQKRIVDKIEEVLAII